MLDACSNNSTASATFPLAAATSPCKPRNAECDARSLRFIPETTTRSLSREAAIFSQIHFAHAAFSELSDQSIVIELRADDDFESSNYATKGGGVEANQG
jgi:hypothetical protein